MSISGGNQKEQHKNYKVVYVKTYKISKHNKWTDMIKEIFPMDTWHTSKDADYNSNAETKLASTEKQSIVSWQLYDSYN